MEYKRVGFDGFVTQDFKGINIKKEKPDKFSNIGNDDSLFCWVQRKFNKGYLLCDDGAMEKADFIHLDGGKTLSLIHVKGAKSDGQERKISVSSYEVVVGQAVKNLLWFERSDLAEALKGRVRKSNSFWKDGAKSSKD